MTTALSFSLCSPYIHGSNLSNQGKKAYQKVIGDLKLTAVINLAVCLFTSSPFLQFLRLGIVAFSSYKVVLIEKEEKNNTNPTRGLCFYNLGKAKAFLVVSNGFLSIGLLAHFILGNFSSFKSGFYGLYYASACYKKNQQYTDFIRKRNLLIQNSEQ